MEQRKKAALTGSPRGASSKFSGLKGGDAHQKMPAKRSHQLESSPPRDKASDLATLQLLHGISPTVNSASASVNTSALSALNLLGSVPSIPSAANTPLQQQLLPHRNWLLLHALVSRASLPTLSSFKIKPTDVPFASPFRASRNSITFLQNLLKTIFCARVLPSSTWQSRCMPWTMPQLYKITFKIGTKK